MSSSNCGGTKRTQSSSSGEGAPAQKEQGPEFEGWGRIFTSGDQGEQVDLKGTRDEVWLTNMDQFFPYPVNENLNSARNVNVGFEWGTVVFHDESSVDKFLDHFQATHFDGVGQVWKKCPNLGRAVRVAYRTECWEQGNDQAYWNKLMEMLENCGDQIWYLTFWWGKGDESDLVDFYRKLKQIVKLMPNLEVLYICYHAFPSDEELLDLEEEILRNPFPEQTNLVMISANGIPDPLCSHLVNQNRQISRLQIEDIDLSENCALFAEKLPNLNQLCFRF